MPATAAPGRFIGQAIAASGVLYSAAFAQSITGIGVLAGQTTSAAYSLSDDGRVVVGHSGDRAIRWTSDTGIQDLGVVAGQSNSAATSVSSDGNTIVGGSGTQAFRWTSSTGMQSVFSASGSLGSYALDISADGSVIAGYRGFDAFAWSQSDGGQVILPEAQARGISADGSTFVGHVSALGRRLAHGSVTLESPANEGFIPKSLRLPIWHTRLMPDLAGGPPLVHDLARNLLADFACVEVWNGAATLDYGESEFEELLPLAPRAVLGGFRCSIAFTITGAEVRPAGGHPGGTVTRSSQGADNAL